MRLNQLPVILEGQFVPSEERATYIFSIAILQIPDGKYTWRGLGQNLPKGRLVSTGVVIFTGDSEDSEWPLNIKAVGVGLDADVFPCPWESVPFDDHDVEWTSDCTGKVHAAQYVRGEWASDPDYVPDRAQHLGR